VPAPAPADCRSWAALAAGLGPRAGRLP
jgi:hypothetical protein